MLTSRRPRPPTLASWKQNYRPCPTVLAVFPPSLISTIRPLALWLLQRSLINIFSSNYPSISGQDSSQMLLSHLPLLLQGRAHRTRPTTPPPPHHPPHQRWYLPFFLNPLSELFPFTLRMKKKKSYLFLGSTRAIKQGNDGASGKRWDDWGAGSSSSSSACWLDRIRTAQRFTFMLINFCVAFPCDNVTTYNRSVKRKSSYTWCPTPDTWLSLSTMTFDLSCLFGVY